MYASDANAKWKIFRIKAQTNAKTIRNYNGAIFLGTIHRYACHAAFYRPDIQSLRIADATRWGGRLHVAFG